jgi:hypothetical protein
MNKQEAAIQYITDNYLQNNRLRRDIVSDKLQIRYTSSEALAIFDHHTDGLDYWKEITN